MCHHAHVRSSKDCERSESSEGTCVHEVAVVVEDVDVTLDVPDLKTRQNHERLDVERHAIAQAPFYDAGDLHGQLAGAPGLELLRRHRAKLYTELNRSCRA